MTRLRERGALAVLTPDEIRQKLAQAREQYFRIRFRHRATPVKNPMEIRDIRRDIARYETFLRAKARDGGSAAT